jgi:hypothetical protein
MYSLLCRHCLLTTVKWFRLLSPGWVKSRLVSVEQTCPWWSIEWWLLNIQPVNAVLCRIEVHLTVHKYYIYTHTWNTYMNMVPTVNIHDGPLVIFHYHHHHHHQILFVYIIIIITIIIVIIIIVIIIIQLPQPLSSSNTIFINIAFVIKHHRHSLYHHKSLVN